MDHTQYDTTSILRTIEKRWDLAPLGTRDAAVNDLSNAFELPAQSTAVPATTVPATEVPSVEQPTAVIDNPSAQPAGMPRTGSGSSPDFPVLISLVGLGLAAAGVGLRRRKNN